MWPGDGRGRSWKEIAIDLVGERDRGRFRALVQELEEALVAQDVADKRQGHFAENPSPLRPSHLVEYAKIVEAAAALMHSEYASLQMLYPERGPGGRLRLLAFQGFNPRAAQFWEWVRADSKSTCGIALAGAQRVVAPDIAACDFMANSEDQQVYLQTGIHACQTTPLISCAGNVVGMISTHWREPHEPSQKDLRLFDILANQAADLIDRSRREQRG